MTFGSLFSGVGGLDLGLERAGFKCIWQCEIDPYCRKVLTKRWPGVPCYEDVRKISKEVERPDWIVGGFPCQPHSTSGKRLAEKDPRELWPECQRLVRLFRPDGCVFENVPGIRTTIADRVLTDLESEGYTCWPNVVGAIHAGARHRRERVFFIAYANSLMLEDREQPTHVKSLRQDVPHATGQRLQRVRKTGEQVTAVSREETVSTGNGSHGSFWELEPELGRVANGVPCRVDRLRGIGNAVVPQVAEAIGRAILRTLSQCK